MSKIKVQRPQVNVQEGAKTYDNQTEEIQQSWRLLIGNGTTGSLGHVIYQAMGPEGICN